MANLNLVQRHNSLFNRIEKATVEDISDLFYDVKDFYAECKEIDSFSAKRIVDKYVEKFQQMLNDNAAAYDKKNEKLSEAKNERYDFFRRKRRYGSSSDNDLAINGKYAKGK